MKSSFILFPPIKCISNCIWRLFRNMNSCEFIAYSLLPSNQTLKLAHKSELGFQLGSPCANTKVNGKKDDKYIIIIVIIIINVMFMLNHLCPHKRTGMIVIFQMWSLHWRIWVQDWEIHKFEKKNFQMVLNFFIECKKSFFSKTKRPYFIILCNT